MQTKVVKTVFNTCLIHGLPAMYVDEFYEMVLALSVYDNHLLSTELGGLNLIEACKKTHKCAI
jgi:hypothetical protein